jgi:hypothetical protein
MRLLPKCPLPLNLRARRINDQKMSAAIGGHTTGAKKTELRWPAAAQTPAGHQPARRRAIRGSSGIVAQQGYDDRHWTGTKPPGFLHPALRANDQPIRPVAFAP